MRIAKIAILLIGALLISACASGWRSQAQNDARSTAPVDQNPANTPPAVTALPTSAEQPEKQINVRSAIARDIPYLETPDADPKLNSLDVFASEQGENLPVMVYIHGGGWRRGDKANVSLKPQAFNAAGFVFISVNYRLLPAADVPTQAQEVAAAIAWVHTHISEYGGDPERIFLMGHSAGAHLVSLVGADPAYLENQGLSLDALQGVVSLDTQAYDVSQIMENLPLVGGEIYQQAFGTDPAFWKRLSPSEYISPERTDLPPFIVAYTGAQASRRIASEQFVQILTNAGIQAELLPAPQKTHGEINQEFGEPDDFVTQAVFDFLNRILVGL